MLLFYFICARQTCLHLFGESPAHVPSSQAINSSWRRTRILRICSTATSINGYNIHRSDWWRWRHRFWHYHSLLEVLIVNLSLYFYRFWVVVVFFKKEVSVYVFTGSTVTYLSTTVQISTGNEKQTETKSQAVQAGRTKGHMVALWKCKGSCFYLRFLVIPYMRHNPVLKSVIIKWTSGKRQLSESHISNAKLQILTVARTAVAGGWRSSLLWGIQCTLRLILCASGRGVRPPCSCLLELSKREREGG